MAFVCRTSDGKMVKLVCLDCRRSNFHGAKGFFLHCHFAHSQQFPTPDAAIEASGEEVDMNLDMEIDMEMNMQGDSGESTPTVFDRAEESAFPTAQEQREDAKDPILSFTFNDAFPHAFAPVTSEQMICDQGSEGTGESKGYSSTRKDACPPVTLEKRKRDQESEGAGESKRLRGGKSR